MLYINQNRIDIQFNFLLCSKKSNTVYLSPLCVTVSKKLHNFMAFEIREIKEEEDATFLGELKNGQQQSVYLVNILHLLLP